MHLVNDTPLPAVLIRNAEASDYITALLVACATFTIGEEGLSLSEQQKPVVVQHPGGLAGDAHFEKSGASVCATGHVYAPRGEARSADATLLVGEQTLRVRAFGVRVWQESLLGDRLTPTSPLPFQRNPDTWPRSYRHLGIYGFQRSFLFQFVAWPPSRLEQTESLEQLRALENGTRIRVVLTDELSPGVDTPEQAAAIEKHLAGK